MSARTDATLARLSTPSLLTDRVYDAIREAIRRGELAPGARLRLRDLAAQLGTSPMPVREAIGRLEQDGLVSRVPHRGAVVADLTPAELAHVYDARLLLEVEAARLGCSNLGEVDLRRMRQAYGRLQAAVAAGRTSDALDRDEEMLTILYAAGGNPVLLDLVEDLWQRCRAFKLLGAADPLVDGEAWATQERLLEAVAARDVDRVAAVTAESLTSATRRIRATLGPHPLAGSSPTTWLSPGPRDRSPSSVTWPRSSARPGAAGGRGLNPASAVP